MAKNPKKIRMEMRKNRAKPPRQKAWGETGDGGDSHAKAAAEQARVRNRGEMSRKRTVVWTRPSPNPTFRQSMKKCACPVAC